MPWRLTRRTTTSRSLSRENLSLTDHHLIPSSKYPLRMRYSCQGTLRCTAGLKRSPNSQSEEAIRFARDLSVTTHPRGWTWTACLTPLTSETNRRSTSLHQSRARTSKHMVSGLAHTRSIPTKAASHLIKSHIGTYTRQTNSYLPMMHKELGNTTKTEQN